ncbi:hypothetical protein M514_15725, partial [Trichuris suis]
MEGPKENDYANFTGFNSITKWPSQDSTTRFATSHTMSSKRDKSSSKLDTTLQCNRRRLSLASTSPSTVGMIES